MSPSVSSMRNNKDRFAAHKVLDGNTSGDLVNDDSCIKTGQWRIFNKLRNYVVPCTLRIDKLGDQIVINVRWYAYNLSPGDKVLNVNVPVFLHEINFSMCTSIFLLMKTEWWFVIWTFYHYTLLCTWYKEGVVTYGEDTYHKKLFFTFQR